jgi:hypothetical protein
MRVYFVRLAILLTVVLSLTVPTVAQEGHPLTGTWYGTYGPNAQTRNDLTVVMDWDGRVNTGFVNPGPNRAEIKTIRMDITPGNPRRAPQEATADRPAVTEIPAKLPEFRVHFEFDAPSGAGAANRCTFDGLMDNPVGTNRVVAGTYTCGNQRGDFRIMRN